jgi:putative integral membrane protein (TIGR02587 family)
MVDGRMSGHGRSEEERGVEHNFVLDLVHDFGGAILFSFPLLMTMEMWWLGFYMDRLQLALLLTLAFIMILGLSYFEGGEETIEIELLDALVACATGYTVAAGMLLVFGIIKPGMSADEIVGKISLHAIPCSIGAILARRQLNIEETEKEKRRKEGYGAKLFLMSVGSIFLAFQLAPTEEMVLIGHMMTGWHAAALAMISLCIMQAFLCSIETGRRKSIFTADFFWGIFIRFTIVGYALALFISIYILWTFGRLEGMSVSEVIMATLVLGFPAALGASAARLIL